MTHPFKIGKKYKRKDIYKIIGIPEDTRGGNWDTGYNKYNNDYFLFCNVGIPGRTGHDYENRFDGHLFHWYAKSRTHIKQPQIQELLHPLGHIYVFYRLSDKNPFTFAGFAKPYSHKNETPMQITWEIIDEVSDAPITKSEKQLYKEGLLQKIYVNTYERNPAARSACIEIFGYQCQVCGINLKDIYGDFGEEFIHIHHLVPISEIGSEYNLDPEKDLIPLCPNCHAIIHRRRPPYEIEEIKKKINSNKTIHTNN